MDSERAGTTEKKISPETVCDVRGMTVRNREGISLVQGIDCRLRAGETLGLVGGSGSGKTLTVKGILGLLPEGLSAAFRHREVTARTAMIFQNPVSALDPLCPVRRQLAEVAAAHSGLSLRKAEEEAGALLARLAFPEEAARGNRYPWELSGGQCQRVLIAMALACRPSLLVCDEPTTALDVSLQAQTLEIIRSLQKEQGFAMIFVTHNLAVASRICERLAVLRDGRILEEGDRSEILRHPREAYTRELIEAVPELPEEAGGANGTIAAT